MSAVISMEQKNVLVFLLHGIAILICNDLLQAWRCTCPHGPVWVGLEDLFFWFLTALRTFVLIFQYQDGVLRLYTVFSIAAGMFLYRRVVGGHLVRGVSCLLLLPLRFVKKIISKISAFRQKTVAKIDKKEYTEHSNLERNVPR